ncbi:MAG: hypothetical protein JWQ44_259 [Chthoniobacter sp.]|nr:hypothetical protein [Chthoniobacter sp.]
MNAPRLLLVLAAPLLCSSAFAEPDRVPPSAATNEDAAAALKKLSVAPGLQVDLWAAEPLLANPVAFCFDERGRAFVAETYRRRSTVPDIRKNEPWQIENLALRSVEERLAFFQRKYPAGAPRPPTKDLPDFDGNGAFDLNDWAVESERVKLVTDSNGDGVADTASVFATGFNSIVTGIGAGLVAHAGAVYYTCVPDLWRLSGEKDGAATKRETLLSGFGVHVVFSGHDMHGARIGPDGKLYWSIADSGARVTTKEGTVLDCPDSGAVFRSDLDGSNAEIVAVGLRNPQHLAFNELGDLFTGDNNADGGDKARWTHLVDGGDYGWRLGWQFMSKSETQPQLGAWNAEGMWHLDVAKTNLSLLPPVAHIGHGPAGIAFYPGTGLPDSYRDHFFYADFPGGVRAFRVTPKGASYTVENPGDILQDNAQKNMTGKLLWGLDPSDVQFGVDGGAYVLDWTRGWEKTGKGRIFRVHDPVTDASPLVQETKKLLAEGMAGRSPNQIAQLLGHPDQRVRQAAQFAAAEKRDFNTLARVATGNGEPLLARLHAIWGLGQLAPRMPRASGLLTSLVADDVAEVRAQAAKVLRFAEADATAGPELIKLLSDAAPRVRFFAAQSLGKLRVKDGVPALFSLLATNADEDAFIRHAAILSLAQIAETEALVAKATDASAAVRTGALLALRRQASPEVARFLADAHPQLVLEAARAIHDGASPAAWPQLAALAESRELARPAGARAINANYLLGTPEAAQRLGRVAADSQMPAERRLAAVSALGIWNQPFGKDAITGLWRDLPPREAARGATEVVAEGLPALLQQPTEALRRAALEAAGSLRIASVADTLLTVVGAATQSGATRAAALRALDAIGSPKLTNGVEVALGTNEPMLLEAARQLAGKASPTLAVQVNARVLGKGSLREQQEALATIAAQPIPEAERVLAEQMDLLIAGKLKPGLQLDVLEAATSRNVPALQQRLAIYDASRSNADALAKWSECLEGGDAKLGRKIFAEKAEAGCLRCHKVEGEGGDVGPDLSAANARRDRTYLLQSIVDPNAVIAPGYQNVLITLQNGEFVGGLLHAETETEITLASLVDGKKQRIAKAQIKERTVVPSAMPPGLGEVLGKRGLRDLIEFLVKAK